MKLNPNRLFVATAISFAVAWVICVFAVMMMPGSMLILAGDMVHLDLSSQTWVITAKGFFAGLTAWSIVAGAVAWLVAVIYNWLAAR